MEVNIMKNKKDLSFVIGCVILGLILVWTKFILLKVIGVVEISIVLVIAYNSICTIVTNEAYLQFYNDLQEKKKENTPMPVTEKRTVAEKVLKISDETMQFIHVQYGGEAIWKWVSNIYNDMAYGNPARIQVTLYHDIYIYDLNYDEECNITEIIPIEHSIDDLKKNINQNCEETNSEREEISKTNIVNSSQENTNTTADEDIDVNEVDDVDIPQEHKEETAARVKCTKEDLDYYWKIKESIIKNAQQIAEDGELSFNFTLSNEAVHASHIKQLIDDDNELNFITKVVSDNKINIAFAV